MGANFLMALTPSPPPPPSPARHYENEYHALHCTREATCPNVRASPFPPPKDSPTSCLHNSLRLRWTDGDKTYWKYLFVLKLDGATYFLPLFSSNPNPEWFFRKLTVTSSVLWALRPFLTDPFAVSWSPPFVLGLTSRS